MSKELAARLRAVMKADGNTFECRLSVAEVGAIVAELDAATNTIAKLADWLNYFEEMILDDNLLEARLERTFIDDLKAANDYVEGNQGA